MCGCKGKNKTLVQESTARVTGFSAQSVESMEGTTIQFIGAGSNLLFWGNNSKTRYYFSTGDIAIVDPKDAETFLKLRHSGKPLFQKVTEENLVSAIEAGEIMSDLETPNTPVETKTEEEEKEVVEDEPKLDVVDQTGFTEDSYEEVLPPFDEDELLPEEETNLPDEDGNEEDAPKRKRNKKNKKNTEEE